MKTKEKSDWTASAVRQAYQSNPDAGFFFDRETMRFFGDRMTSFRCTKVNGVDYLYRRPTAEVCVFGNWKTAGREFFGVWKITEEGGRIDLDSCGTIEVQAVYDAIS